MGQGAMQDMPDKDLKITVDIQFSKPASTKKPDEPKAKKKYPPTYTFQKSTILGSYRILLDPPRWDH